MERRKKAQQAAQDSALKFRPQAWALHTKHIPLRFMLAKKCVKVWKENFTALQSNPYLENSNVDSPTKSEIFFIYTLS